MNRKAFTLIELLVVIAIIAILAAILFPVFAQAKQAAKAAASLSNAKQQTLGVVMYAGDFDDNLVLGTAWNTGSDQLCYGAGQCFSVWSWSIAPYVKNSQIYMDPLATANGKAPNNLPQSNYDSYYIQYGYNYTFLSPMFTLNGPEAGLSSTAVGDPAGTVMLAAKWAESENKSGLDYATWFPPPNGGQLAAAAVDAPDCGDIQQYCMSSWGTGTFYSTSMQLTTVEGGLTGGVSTRAANQAIITFVDGHAKKMSPGALAAGTNWTPTRVATSVTFTDITKYLWDLQ